MEEVADNILEVHAYNVRTSFTYEVDKEVLAGEIVKNVAPLKSIFNLSINPPREPYYYLIENNSVIQMNMTFAARLDYGDGYEHEYDFECTLTLARGNNHSSMWGCQTETDGVTGSPNFHSAFYNDETEAISRRF